MIYIIFTLDYEIFGNGTGSLEQHVFNPTVKLNKIFDQFGFKYVNFVEAAELIKIEEYSSDKKINDVVNQIKEMYLNGYEIALHIHPQWFNAAFLKRKWELDYNEYNLALLEPDKINAYLGSCISYLQNILNDSLYIPTSYRAGNWLIQPSQNISLALAERGIKIDSSVFRGGHQIFHSLDFRNYPKNLFYWNFLTDVMEPNSLGKIIEIPIYSEMVYFWKMYSPKRKKIHEGMNKRKNLKYQLLSKLEIMRVKYPKKFDFTKMTFSEMKEMIDNIIRIDKDSSNILKPVVLIGHTKNLFDYKTIEKFLKYTTENNITVTTFREVIKEIESN
jgi:hypothetical protein